MAACACPVQAQGEPARLPAGIDGRWYGAAASRPVAVIVMGGSEGGLSTAEAVAPALTRHGYAVLALGWLGTEHTPSQLELVPLDLVQRAVDWIRDVHGAGIRHVVLMGLSRGAEAAMLAAAHARGVSAVIGFSPSSVAWEAAGCTGKSAWTLQGKPLPFVACGSDRTSGLAAMSGPLDALAEGRLPPEQMRAVIPRAAGGAKVLLVASADDRVWPSLRMAQSYCAMPSAGECRVLAVRDASHMLMGPGPGLVAWGEGEGRIHFGGTEEGTRRARDTAWAATLDLLATLR